MAMVTRTDANNKLPIRSFHINNKPNNILHTAHKELRTPKWTGKIGINNKITIYNIRSYSMLLQIQREMSITLDKVIELIPTINTKKIKEDLLSNTIDQQHLNTINMINTIWKNINNNRINRCSTKMMITKWCRHLPINSTMMPSMAASRIDMNNQVLLEVSMSSNQIGLSNRANNNNNQWLRANRTIQGITIRLQARMLLICNRVLYTYSSSTLVAMLITIQILIAWVILSINIRINSNQGWGNKGLPT